MNKSIDFGPNFDWFVVLGQLSKDGRISNADYAELQMRAGQWPNCACGQLCKLLPKTQGENFGAPKDEQLKQWGITFSDHIGYRDWIKALRTFEKIEARSTLLLKQMGVKFIKTKHHKFRVVIPKVLKPLKPCAPKPFAARMAESHQSFTRPTRAQ